MAGTALTDALAREPGDERAMLEELAGAPQLVRATDRRWMPVLVGIVAIAGAAFLGTLVPPPDPLARALSPIAGGHSVKPSPTEPPSAAPLELLLPGESASVTAGLVPVALRAAPGHSIHVSITVGDRVLGRRDVVVGSDGTWSGSIEVLAPKVALPAVAHATALLDASAVVAVDGITSPDGPRLVMREVVVMAAPDGTLSAHLRAVVPRTYDDLRSWITDLAGHLLGAPPDRSNTVPWPTVSPGGVELGPGSTTAVIPIDGQIDGKIVVHVTWTEIDTGAKGVYQRVVDPLALEP